jgi:hypothetical protein
MLAALRRTSWRRVPGLGLEVERPAWRARRGLGAGFPLDFFEGTTNLAKRKNIVTEGAGIFEVEVLRASSSDALRMTINSF